MLTPIEIALALEAAGLTEAAAMVRGMARKRREQNRKGH